MGWRVRIVAVSFGLAGGLLLLLGYPVAVMLAGFDKSRSITPQDAGLLFVLAAILVLLPALLGAILTLRDRPAGPALLGYVAALLLFLFPVGTVIGVAALWALAPIIRRNWARQRAALAGPAPSVGPPPASHAVPPWPPAGRPLGPCVHLRPVEAAMRARGIALQASPWGRLRADCTVDLLALARRLDGLGPLALTDLPPGEVAAAGPPRALLWCSACETGIEVIAPGRAPRGTPIFPEPAAL